MAYRSSRQTTTPPLSAGSRVGVVSAAAERFARSLRARPIAAHLVLMGTIAFSCGVHSGLVVAHLDDSPLLPASFLASALLLAGTGVALAAYPASMWPQRMAAAVFAALIVAYLVFTGRLLDPIGVTTKLVEAAGIAVALSIRPTPALGDERRALVPVYILLVAFVVMVSLQASGHHQH